MLLEPKHENVAPWFQIWWDALPTKADFLWRRQPFPTDHLALLQDEALVRALLRGAGKPACTVPHTRLKAHIAELRGRLRLSQSGRALVKVQ